MSLLEKIAQGSQSRDQLLQEFLNSLPSQRYQEVSFQFPTSPYPLAKLAKTIHSIQQGKFVDLNQAVQQFDHSFNTLDEPSKQLLLSDEKIADVLNHSHHLSKLYFSPDWDAFNQLEQKTKHLLAGFIYQLSTDPNKENWGWGGAEHHALDDLDCLKKAVFRLVDQNLLLPCAQKISQFALSPLQTLSTATYLKNWEDAQLDTPSQYDKIDGNELPQGEIGFINGMGCGLTHARSDAQQIRDAHCQGYAMPCVYAATQGETLDLACAALGQRLSLFPQGRLLIQRWTEFFERSESHEKYLQICTSRGAIDVAAALNVLPSDLKQRIIVIAIAPGYIIEKAFCYKAINLVITEDMVPYLAPNSGLIGKDSVVKIVPNHSDGNHPHNPHGSSYREVISPLVQQYIQTNDIGLD